MTNSSWLDDSALTTARRALDGLALQQQVLGRNVANVDTPGYSAETVDFAATLRQAEAGQGGLALEVTNARHLALSSQSGQSAARIVLRAGGSARADGNNVNIDDELLDLSKTGIQYEALSQLVTKKLALLKAIATGH